MRDITGVCRQVRRANGRPRPAMGVCRRRSCGSPSTIGRGRRRRLLLHVLRLRNDESGEEDDGPHVAEAVGKSGRGRRERTGRSARRSSGGAEKTPLAAGHANTVGKGTKGGVRKQTPSHVPQKEDGIVNGYQVKSIISHDMDLP
ncbi:hypothetical protein KPB2_5513 [Klebsiella pneumoniae Kb677]|nr:hypothetical protein KPB2_5513 [Klebsiella pneumoniae Kb677]